VANSSICRFFATVAARLDGVMDVVSISEASQLEQIAKLASTTITGMKITKGRATCKLAVIILSTTAQIVLAQPQSNRQSESPSVRVLVLDALNGKPQVGVDVDYLCDEIPHSTATYEITDKTGTAEVPFSCRPGNKIELDAVPTSHKEGCGGGVAATLQEIETVGVVSKPDSDGGIWCPTKISRKLTAVPGQVILFVKKPTWWQSHVAG
jgi:hypothetical protein